MSKEIWSLNIGPKGVRSFVGQRWPEPFFSSFSFLITFRRHSVADGEWPWPPVSEWGFCCLSQEMSGLASLFLLSSGWHMFWPCGLFGLYVTSHTMRSSLTCLYVCPKWKWGKTKDNTQYLACWEKRIYLSFFSHSLQPLGGRCKEVISKFSWVGAFLKLIDLTYRECLYITSVFSLWKDGFYHKVDCSGVSALRWVRFIPKGFVLLPSL